MKIKYCIEKKENKKNIALVIEKEYCIEKKNIVLKKKKNIVMKKRKKNIQLMADISLMSSSSCILGLANCFS